MQRRLIFTKIIWKSTPLKPLNQMKSNTGCPYKTVSDTTGLHPRWSQLLNRQFLQIKKLLHFKLKWYEFQTSALCQWVVYTGIHNSITPHFCYAPVLAFYFPAPCFRPAQESVASCLYAKSTPNSSLAIKLL